MQVNLFFNYTAGSPVLITDDSLLNHLVFSQQITNNERPLERRSWTFPISDFNRRHVCTQVLISYWILQVLLLNSIKSHMFRVQIRHHSWIACITTTCTSKKITRCFHSIHSGCPLWIYIETLTPIIFFQCIEFWVHSCYLCLSLEWICPGVKGRRPVSNKTCKQRDEGTCCVLIDAPQLVWVHIVCASWDYDRVADTCEIEVTPASETLQERLLLQWTFNSPGREIYKYIYVAVCVPGSGTKQG